MIPPARYIHKKFSLVIPMEKRATSYFEGVKNVMSVEYSEAVSMINETAGDPYLAENHPDALKFLNKFQSYLAAAGYEIKAPEFIPVEEEGEKEPEQPVEENIEEPVQEEPVQEEPERKRRRKRRSTEE